MFEKPRNILGENELSPCKSFGKMDGVRHGYSFIEGSNHVSLTTYCGGGRCHSEKHSTVVYIVWSGSSRIQTLYEIEIRTQLWVGMFPPELFVNLITEQSGGATSSSTVVVVRDEVQRATL